METKSFSFFVLHHLQMYKCLFLYTIEQTLSLWYSICGDKMAKLNRNIDLYKCQSKNVQICSLKNVQFYN